MEQNYNLKSDFSAFLDEPAKSDSLKNELLFFGTDPYAIEQSHLRSGSANINYSSLSEIDRRKVSDSKNRNNQSGYESLNQIDNNSLSVHPAANAKSMQHLNTTSGQSSLTNMKKGQNPFEETLEDPFADFNKIS